MTIKEIEEKNKLQDEYKETLKEFAKHYVALWNALDMLGLTNAQIKGVIELILPDGLKQTGGNK